MATTSNYSWTTPDDTDLVKDGAAAIRTLGSAIDTTVFTNAGAAVAKATVDAKGDLLVGTADNTVDRLAVGTDGYTLVADSAETTGLKWQAPAAGGFTLISTSTPSGATAVDFTTISSDYSQLLVTWAGIYAASNNSNFLIRLNNDSGTEYKQRELEASGASTMSVYLGVTDSIPCMVRTTSTTETETAAGYMLIFNANSTTLDKYIETVTSYKRADTSTNVIRRSSFHYNSTSAISQINFFRGETAGTISVTSGGFIQLWGLK